MRSTAFALVFTSSEQKEAITNWSFPEQTDALMKRIHPLYLFTFAIALLAIPLIKYRLSHATSFYGIAENPVKTFNFDFPVEILHTFRQTGEFVKSGDTILTLRRLDMKMRERNITYEQQEVRLKLQFDKATLATEAEQLRTKKKQLESKRDFELAKLEENEALISAATAIAVGSETDIPLANRNVQDAKHIRDEFAQNLAEVEIAMAQNARDRSSAEALANHRIEKLSAELSDLRNSEAELVLISSDNGMIGQMDVGADDKVEAFTPLVKLYEEHPNTAVFFIGDRQLTLLKVGDSLWVESLNLDNLRYRGVVSSLGTRITSYPERLKKFPEARVWGREVQVQLPPDNPFLQGERVKISF